LLDCATLKIFCSIPSANSLIQKCLKIHLPKYRRREKLRLESCCLLKTRNLQTQYVDLSRKINADTSTVYTSRKIKDKIKVREDKPPLENAWCNVSSVTCAMQVMWPKVLILSYLHQRIEEHEGSAVGQLLRSRMTMRKVLKVYRSVGTNDCPGYFPTLNKSCVSIGAKQFV